MKNKAIIFDIDGTAVNSPSKYIASDRLIRAIRNAEKEYFLCAATGRVWSFAKPVLKHMQLVDPCIISGGAQICDPESGKILWQCNIEPSDLKAAITVIKNFPEFMTLYNEYDEEDYLRGGVPPTELDIHEPTYILEQKFIPEYKAPKIIAKLSEIEGIAPTLVVAQRPGFNDIHITNRDATKEHAIAELLSIIGVDRESTIGVGDGHNDIHLFNGVGYKVAMGNAVEELKEAADLVIDDINNDGFAKYLRILV